MANTPEIKGPKPLKVFVSLIHPAEFFIGKTAPSECTGLKGLGPIVKLDVGVMVKLEEVRLRTDETFRPVEGLPTVRIPESNIASLQLIE